MLTRSPLGLIDSSPMHHSFSFRPLALPVAALTLALGLGLASGCGVFTKIGDCKSIVQATHDAEKLVDDAAKKQSGDDFVAELKDTSEVVAKAKTMVEQIEITDETLLAGKAELVTLYGDMATLMGSASTTAGEYMKRAEAGDEAVEAEIDTWSTDFQKKIDELIEREHKIIGDLDSYCGAV
jgi:hypothetical protein